MKLNKRVLSLILAMVFLLGVIVPVTAEKKETATEKLQKVELLDADNSEEALNGALKRSEGLTMVLKALGYSQKVSEDEKFVELNPFTDAPEWFKGYAGLGFDRGIAAGVADDRYDPDGELSKQEFIAFILRALNWDSKEAYVSAKDLGVKAGILEENEDINAPITKAEAAGYIFKALNADLQDGTGYTLGEFLVNNGIISEEKAKEIGIQFGSVDEQNVYIVYNNDFHGNISEEVTGKKRNMGMAKMVGYVNEFAQKHKNTIVLAGGDNYQGTADSNLTMGKPVSAMLKGMNTVASAVGNHEFDWGADKIEGWAKDGNFKFIASNIYNKETDKPVEWADPYMIIESGGLKIGLVGLAHPDTSTLTKEQYVKGFEFKDPVASAQEWVNFLREGKAEEGTPDVIIALTHIDSNQDKDGTISGNAVELAEKVEGLDAILSAHSHRTVNGVVNDVPILQAYCYGRAVGVFKINVNEEGKFDGIEGFVHSGNDIKNNIIKDKEAEKFYDDLQKELNPIKGEVIGEANGEFTHDRSNKGSNTLLGRWSCEVMAEKTDAQIGIQNGGGLRRTLESGQITMGDMYEIMPFDNYLVVMDLPGDALIKAIDHGINMPKTTDGAFSGLKVEFDSSKPYGEQITKITLTDGTPIEKDKMYRVVTNDFMFTGGDGYDFSAAENVDETYIPIRDVLVEAIKDAKTITPQPVDYIIDVNSADKAA
ncbi:MAG: 5'-nucleotidase C-terminal domain-containing protein [Tissierellia bacterium]|nr:5'-nucleotidase C-terminal domain-containing protein [Tissierellia bacterium]